MKAGINILVPRNLAEKFPVMSCSPTSSEARDRPITALFHHSEASSEMMGAATSMKIRACRTEVSEAYARNRIQSGSTMCRVWIRETTQIRPANSSSMK